MHSVPLVNWHTVTKNDTVSVWNVCWIFATSHGWKPRRPPSRMKLYCIWPQLATNQVSVTTRKWSKNKNKKPQNITKYGTTIVSPVKDSWSGHPCCELTRCSCLTSRTGLEKRIQCGLNFIHAEPKAVSVLVICWTKFDYPGIGPDERQLETSMFTVPYWYQVWPTTILTFEPEEDHSCFDSDVAHFMVISYVSHNVCVSLLTNGSLSLSMTLTLFLSLWAFFSQAIHLAQASFQLEAFGSRYVLDLKLNK